MADPTFVSFASRVLHHTANAPDRRAVVCDGAALSYRDLIDRASRCGQRLRALGLAPGGDQRVGILASNGLDVVVVVVASQLIGVALVPLPTLILPDAQARMIEDASVTVLFHDLHHAEAARQARTLIPDQDRLTLIPIGGPDFDQWLGRDSDGFVPSSVERDWVSDLIYSSGTTGTPKGILQAY